MTPPKPIVDVFAEIVADVESELLSTLQAFQPKIRAINYQHGHPREIIETLVQYDEHPEKRFEKYPLVMLIQDFPETMGKSGGYYSEVSLRLVIAHTTKPDYKADQRYTNTFNPILYKIYGELITQLTESRYFVIPDETLIEHTKKDRLYWGRESLNGDSSSETCDYVDAIEITNLKLTVDLDTCTLYFNP